MQPHDKGIRKFKMDTPYEHKRSDGTTRRKNKGSQYVLDSRVVSKPTE